MCCVTNIIESTLSPYGTNSVKCFLFCSVVVVMQMFSVTNCFQYTRCLATTKILVFYRFIAGLLLV